MTDGSRTYDKPWLSFDEQAERLIGRGLHDAGEHLGDLERIGYYRLSGYWYPFRQIDLATGERRDEFFDDVTFADVRALYDFDARLRDAVFRAISAVEIAVRVQLGYELGRIDRFVHLQLESLDRSVRVDQFAKFQGNLRELQSKSREDFVEHFKTRYDGKLPIWVVTEILQFGQLVKLYEFAPYQSRVEIAAQVDARADEYKSWLKAVNIVRNVAAHHSRLWNRSIGLKPQLSHRRADPELRHAVGSVDRVYGVIAVTAYLLRKFELDAEVADLRRVLLSFPDIAGISPDMMKLPATWADERLWGER